MRGTIISFCYSLFLLTLTSKFHDAVADQLPSRGGITAPRVSTCFYDGTTGTADALNFLISDQDNYGFFQFPRITYILIITRMNIVSVPGVAAKLITRTVVGYAFLVRNQVHFLNVIGCPAIILVPNSRTSVYGFPFLYGNQIYQAFSALNLPNAYSCSTCTNSDWAIVPYQSADGQGLNVIFVNQLQNFVVVDYSRSVPSLVSNIQSRLQSFNVSAIVSAGSGFVTVYDRYSVTRPCIYPPPTSSGLDAVSSTVQNPNNFSGKRNICNLAVNVAATIASSPSLTVTVPINLVIPLLDGKLVIISCYALSFLFNSLIDPLLNIC